MKNIQIGNTKYSPKTVIDSLETYITKLKAVPEKKGRFMPAIEQIWWFVRADGTIESCFWEDCIFDLECYNQGNCYETKEQAQAVSDLQKHVYEFDMPEAGANFVHLRKNLDDTLEWKEMENFKGDFFDIGVYHSGYIMPITATKKDRAKRLELLKLAYGV